MVRWLRWHCPPDTGFEIRALAVWGRARYLSVTEAPHNTNFHTWMGKKQFCFFQTAETGNRTPDSGVIGSGANHYPKAPAHILKKRLSFRYYCNINSWAKVRQNITVFHVSDMTRYESLLYKTKDIYLVYILKCAFLKRALLVHLIIRHCF